MRLRHAKTLITGKPGVGKTTLIRNITGRMESVSMAGFFTAEIRSRGARLGFELIGLNGKRRTLDHVDIRSRHRVGRYGVDTVAFEAFMDSLDLLNPDVGLIVIGAAIARPIGSNWERPRAAAEWTRQMSDAAIG